MYILYYRTRAQYENVVYIHTNIYSYITYSYTRDKRLVGVASHVSLALMSTLGS